MRLLAEVAVAAVALLHVWIFILESFLWTKPLGRKVFGLSKELAESSAVLAANQGVYNSFLAAGLIWSFVDPIYAFSIRVFFLSCVIVAGIVGGLTARRSIIVVQALPAAIALTLVFLAG